MSSVSRTPAGHWRVRFTVAGQRRSLTFDTLRAALRFQAEWRAVEKTLAAELRSS